jgi:hypothetical protein
MNTQQITKLLEGLSGFRGVFASDKIPPLVPSSRVQGLVANLDPSWKPGSHWVALFWCKPNTLEYFDSYGLPPLIPLTKSWKILYNKRRFQKFNSRVCGHYCVYVVKNRLSGTKFANVLKTLANQTDSDEFVRRKIKSKILGRGQCCLRAPKRCCITGSLKCCIHETEKT